MTDDNNASPWQKTDSTTAHSNPWFRVRRDEVIRPDGKPGEYYVIDVPAVVMVVAVNDKQEICLIREYRYPHQRWLWEAPIGRVEPEDGSLVAAATRELEEETGLTATDWQSVGTIRVFKGASNGEIHVFVAQGLTAGKATMQIEEGIDQQRYITFSAFLQEVKDGVIVDSETISGVMQAALYLGWLTP